ncbi:MFS transporter [Nocardioides bruguierae]|uniref:MFS transporter n=1 Tax=Nocardioides bruguierae TaxID=2945102 RepID=UPI0020215F51|nr:MFS transporter [Nocardioides bruguierae]MCL8025812.1 MFS transporter [Nocardioides bruguierae]
MERALTFSTAGWALANGLFYSISALYFTQVIGLSAATVGWGLSVAGGVGVLCSLLGGRLADRVPADRIMQVSGIAQAVGLLVYVTADDALSFVLVASAVSGARSVQGSARQAMLAQWFSGRDRVAVRARLHVVLNVFIGVGTVLAALPLLVGTPAAYHATIVLVGVLALLAVVPVVGLRHRVPGLLERLGRRASPEEAAAPRVSPLRDRTYLTATLLTSLMALQFGLQGVVVPLWIAERTDAPHVMVSVVLVTNTVLVALTQVRVSRGTEDVAVSGRAVRRAGFLLLAACLVFPLSGWSALSVPVVVAVLLLAGVLATFGEVWGEAGSWGLSFELADPRAAGAYQGVSQTGMALAGMLAPGVLTSVVLGTGAPGWAVVGVGFAVVGSLTVVLADRVARRRPVADEVLAA